MAIEIIKAFNNNDNFVFIPACCYAGNQFKVLKYNYPPLFTLDDIQIDMPVTITDVPRLDLDGSGKIEVTSGDAATPAVGVFSPSLKRGLLVFTLQEIDGKNIGLAYENGEIRLTWPAKREKIYTMCKMSENTDEWQNEPREIPHKVLDFPCENIAEFYRIFFENRKIMGLDSERPEVIPFEKQFLIHRKKFNNMNWNEQLGIYQVGTTNDKYQVWQPGWVGGAISGYPLMMLGGETELEREMKTLSFLFSTQGDSGFFQGNIDAEGNASDDIFTITSQHLQLTRKSADAFYFLFKHFKFMQKKNLEIPKSFIEGAKKAADGFLRLYNRYGQFGQFVDINTGDIFAGGSTSASMAPAGLAEAYMFFNNPEYLIIAKASAEDYYKNWLSKGYTTGGPGEILQGVDSESAFGLLESFVVLYEVTNEDRWLEYAKECAHYCSTWVVSYNYKFPKNCEFARLNIKTIGSVFANIQNKHSAPGICTLSGDSLYKLWKWTNDPLYLELLKDIALPLGQYISTDERPIYDWDAKNSEDILAHRLPAGFMNERVNMSDWEGEDCVGGVFNGSCWPETSNLLTLAEVIPLLQKEGL